MPKLLLRVDDDLAREFADEASRRGWSLDKMFRRSWEAAKPHINSTCNPNKRRQTTLAADPFKRD